MIVTFDPKSHGYAIDDRPAPGIHELAGAVGLLGEEAHIPEEYKVRGQFIHEAIELDIRGRLDEASCPSLMGWVRASRLARQELGITIADPDRQVEALVSNPGLWYATKVDLLSFPFCVNWKGGVPMPFHAIQSAAEVLCLPGAGWRRVSTYLREDGTYTPVWHEDERDFDIWRSACNLYDWICRRHQSVRPRGVKRPDAPETVPVADSTLFDARKK